MVSKFISKAIKVINRRPWLRLIKTSLTRAYTENIFTDAASLTFSSVMAMVPMITVVLSVFAVLPAFKQMQVQLENWLLNSLVPENIGEQVLNYTNQFAEQASNLGLISGVFLFISSVMLISSITSAFNKIWHTKTFRPLPQKIFIYWSCITLFPIMLAIGISINSYILYLSSSFFSQQQQYLIVLTSLLEAGLFLLASTVMFYLLPEAKVKLKHAFIGAVLVTIIIWLAKRIWLIYYALVPTYSLVYGTFVIVPLLLLWIYVLWLIVLIVAILVSTLPDLKQTPSSIPHGMKGWKFKLACNIIKLLQQGINNQKALDINQMADILETHSFYVREILTSLIGFGWVSQIINNQHQESYILSIDCSKTSARPLVTKLLLNDNAMAVKLVDNYDTLFVQQLLN